MDDSADSLDLNSGDSCHPMLPYLAQGANSSLEDGAVLGLLLGYMTDKKQMPHILRLYESLRKSRGEAIVRETFKQVGAHQIDSQPMLPNCLSRDTTFTWKTAKSRRSEMTSSFHNSERRSRVHFRVDGEFWRFPPVANSDWQSPGHVPKCSLGCMATTPSRKLKRPLRRIQSCSHERPNTEIPAVASYNETQYQIDSKLIRSVQS